MTSEIKMPRNMRIVPTTGAVILAKLPDVPDEWMDGPDANGQSQRSRLAEARQALDRLSSCWMPGLAELACAPILDFQDLVYEDGLVSLCGRVFGHPEIPNGHLCVTSVLLAYDGRRQSWARTVSRWYRLGPAPTEQ